MAEELLEYDLLLARVKAGATVYKVSKHTKEKEAFLMMDLKRPYTTLIVVPKSMEKKFFKTCEENKIDLISLGEWVKAEKEAVQKGRINPIDL